jgi:putative drug exporter of the RND superfamily
MNRIADLTWKHPKLVLAVVGIFVVFAAAAGKDVESHLKAAGFADSASESERATTLLHDSLGYNPNPAIVLVVRNPGGGKLNLSSPAVQREVDRISRGMAGVEYVGHVVNPLREPRAGAKLIARDGESIAIAGYLSTTDIEDAGGIAAEGVEPLIASSSLNVEMGGFAPGFNETNDQTREDLTKAELIAFPILALLLLFVFRGVVAASIPLLIGVVSIVGTLMVLRIMSTFTDTSLFALNIATGMSLGLAVDYALLMVSRYREEIGRGGGASREAHRRTVQTAGRTAVFSGLTVAAALAALIVMPQRFLYSMAVAGASVAILSSVIAILVVPSLLALLGTRIDALSIRRGPAVSDTSDGWYRLARGVMHRPVAVALASSAMLLAAASPLLWTTLTGPSSEAVPPGQPSYDAYQYLEAHYPRDVTEAVTVTVDGGTGPAQLAGFRRQIEAVDGVAGGSPFIPTPEGAAYANFAPSEQALQSGTQDAVHAIRDLSPPGATTVLVSGNTAGFIDQKQSLIEHAPLVIGIIALTTLVLLFLLTGSVLLPVKTLVMNSLTLGATLGILVLAFQEGWLQSPLDYTGPNAIEVTSLVFLFAVIFGLATDYAVLVIARIKERRDLGDSNEEAVAVGIARTGRVITAAALAIAVVFLAFSVSSVFFVKQIAIGMAVGVMLDATVVRALLVPSLMRLFGEWNWWAPKPLRRLQERLGFSESEPATETT